MKHSVFLFFAALSWVMAANVACADTHMEEVSITEHAEDETHEESNVYMIVKGLYSVGETVDETERTLNGGNGKDFGLDLGYRLEEGLALELDFSYEQNTVTEQSGRASLDFDAEFYTAAIDVVYTYEATESLGIFGKVGFEYEWSDIQELGSENDSGLVVGFGMEYALNERYRFVCEYESATIQSARGDGIFAGVMINF